MATPPDFPVTLADLNTHLVEVGAARRQHQESAVELGLELGALTRALRDSYSQSKAKSSALAGISPSHMTALMDAAAAAGVGVPAVTRMPSLSGAALISYVEKHGGPKRILGALHRGDLIWEAALHPEHFWNRGSLELPSVVIQTADESWVALGPIYTVGYGGTGPHNTLSALESLGLDSDFARTLIRYKYLDVDLTQPRDQWQLHTTSLTTDLSEPTFDPMHGVVVRVFPDPLRGRNELADWITYLDRDPLPAFAWGQRHVRIYLNSEAARGDGFTSHRNLGYPYNSARTYSLIVEQNEVQLWVDMLESTDPSKRFTDEIYEALDLLGIPAAEDRHHDGQSAPRRWLRRAMTGFPAQPDYISSGTEIRTNKG